MNYTVTFRVEPSAPFGLPQEGTTVLPGNVGQWYGPTLDSATGLVAGHGTLPIYRTEAQRVFLSVELPGVLARFHDDYLFATVSASSARDALGAALVAVGLLMRLLCLERGELFLAKVESVVDQDLKAYPLPTHIPMGSFTIYDTAHLSHQIREGAYSSAVSDERLRKALLYFQNGAALFAQHLRRPADLTTAAFSLASLTVLELWKACTAVVGDPAIKRDRYQSRYRTLGIDQTLKDRIDNLKSLRDQYDVAHYSLAADLDQTLGQRLPEAFKTAQDTVMAYARYLRSTQTPPSPRPSDG